VEYKVKLTDAHACTCAEAARTDQGRPDQAKPTTKLQQSQGKRSFETEKTPLAAVRGLCSAQTTGAGRAKTRQGKARHAMCHVQVEVPVCGKELWMPLMKGFST